MDVLILVWNCWLVRRFTVKFAFINHTVILFVVSIVHFFPSFSHLASYLCRSELARK